MGEGWGMRVLKYICEGRTTPTIWSASSAMPLYFDLDLRVAIFLVGQGTKQADSAQDPVMLGHVRGHLEHHEAAETRSPGRASGMEEAQRGK